MTATLGVYPDGRVFVSIWEDKTLVLQADIKGDMPYRNRLEMAKQIINKINAD